MIVIILKLNVGRVGSAVRLISVVNAIDIDGGYGEHIFYSRKFGLILYLKYHRFHFRYIIMVLMEMCRNLELHPNCVTWLFEFL